jgi:hypothetical protein
MAARLIIFVLLITTSLTSFSQTKLYFPNLTGVSIDTTDNVFFAYDKKFTHFINKSCSSLDRKDPLFCEKDSVPVEWIVIAKFKNETLKDSLTIIYSEGLSADPEYIVSTKTGEFISRFSCKEFYINGSGTIYTSGHVNNMYNRRRKYQIQNDTIIEINQPYSYVGLKGKTLKAITLYKDTEGNEIVAQIPKDYEIEILLTGATTKDFEMDYNFLVKTDFGLVGWLRLTNEDTYGTVLKDLYFAGD